jgi:hypothetical protein
MHIIKFCFLPIHQIRFPPAKVRHHVHGRYSFLLVAKQLYQETHPIPPSHPPAVAAPDPKLVEAEAKAAQAAQVKEAQAAAEVRAAQAAAESKAAQAAAEVKAAQAAAKEASPSAHSSVSAAPSLPTPESPNSIQIEVVLISAGGSPPRFFVWCLCS